MAKDSQRSQQWKLEVTVLSLLSARTGRSCPLRIVSAAKPRSCRPLGFYIPIGEQLSITRATSHRIMCLLQRATAVKCGHRQRSTAQSGRSPVVHQGVPPMLNTTCRPWFWFTPSQRAAWGSGSFDWLTPRNDRQFFSVVPTSAAPTRPASGSLGAPQMPIGDSGGGR